jgi:GNAT superfamily N-acetyltransferase
LIKIRESTFEFETLERLDYQIFPTDYRHDFTSTINWLLFDDRSPVGFCSLKILDKENAVYLARAGILKPYRGKGLHKRLIRVRTKWAKANDFKSVITYTKRDNHGSANNLIDLGFRLYTPEYEWADKECVYFIKVITL